MKSLTEVSKFKMLSFFSGMVFTLSFLTPFYLSKGLDAYQILLMQSIYMGLIMILEVPSGAFSDRYGRKLTLSISFLSFVFAWIVLIFANEFYSLVLYQAFFALGISFKSGTYSAMIYEICNNDKENLNYGAVMTDINSMRMLSASVSAFLSSILYYLGGFDLVLTLTIISSMLAFLTVLLLNSQTSNNKKSKKKAYKRIIIDAFKELGLKKNVRLSVLNAVVGGVTINTFFHFNQLILKKSGVPVSLNGIFMGCVFLLSTLVMKKLSFKLKRRSDTNKLLLRTNIAISLTFLSLSILEKSYFAAFLLILLLMSNHIRVLFTNKLLNEAICGDNRATTLSYVSLVQSFGGMIIAPIYGKIYALDSGLLIIVSMIVIAIVICNIAISSVKDSNIKNNKVES